jgi:NAD+ kinase
MKMTINGRTLKGTIVGDGIIVSTPQGSTGYNRSAGGKIIKPSIPVLQVTPKSCTIGDRRAVMSSFIERDDSIISIEFEDYEYRSAEVWADGIKLNKTDDPIKRITFKKSSDTVRLLFDNEYGFYDKIYNLQYDSGACQIG